MKKGQVVAWFEGSNHVCGVLLEDFKSTGTCIAATSLTYGAQDVDFVYRNSKISLARFEGTIPSILKKYIPTLSISELTKNIKRFK